MHFEVIPQNLCDWIPSSFIGIRFCVSVYAFLEWVTNVNTNPLAPVLQNGSGKKTVLEWFRGSYFYAYFLYVYMNDFHIKMRRGWFYHRCVWCCIKWKILCLCMELMLEMENRFLNKIFTRNETHKKNTTQLVCYTHAYSNTTSSINIKEFERRFLGNNMLITCRIC